MTDATMIHRYQGEDGARRLQIDANTARLHLREIQDILDKFK